MFFLAERVELPCLPEGRAWYEADGLRLKFECTLPERDGVHKLWLCRGERRLLLGTPKPEERGLVLRRSVSCALLRQQGVFPPQRLEVVGGGAGKSNEMPPESGEARSNLNDWQSTAGQESRLTRDELLRAALRRGGWFWRREGDERNGKICLRCRWQPGDPFPIPPLFCLTVPERSWLIIWLDGGGNPCLPP